MGKSVQTIHRVVRSFEDHGHKVVLRRKFNGAEPKIKGAIKQTLLSHQWLRAFCHLSLKDRCVMIHRQFGISICPSTLSKLYKDNRIVRGTPKYLYESAIKNRVELNKERVKFAVNLATIIRRGDPIVYFDETSLNAW